jgi:hypothetical protein
MESYAHPRRYLFLKCQSSTLSFRIATTTAARNARRHFLALPTAATFPFPAAPAFVALSSTATSSGLESAHPLGVEIGHFFVAHGMLLEPFGTLFPGRIFAHFFVRSRQGTVKVNVSNRAKEKKQK